VSSIKSVLRATTFHLRNQVYPEIIGWMMKTARSVMTVRAYSRRGGANIIVVYAVNFSLSAKAFMYSYPLWSRPDLLLTMCI
jgi:hypothetical protein